MTKNFILTGATSDIGKAIAQELSTNNNATVIATGFSHALEGLPANWILLNNLDLCKPQDLDRLHKAATSTFEEPFTVIHSVGRFWKHTPIHKFSTSSALEMMNSHYLTLYGVLNTLLPLGARLGGARILGFSCNSVQFNYPEMSAFTSSKAAIECLIKCVANEWSEFNIIANSIALPTIATDGVADLVSEGRKAGPTESYMSPSHIADTVVNHLLRLPKTLNGNTIRAFSHSPHFYNTSYFSRNPPHPKDSYIG